MVARNTSEARTAKEGGDDRDAIACGSSLNEGEVVAEGIIHQHKQGSVLLHRRHLTQPQRKLRRCYSQRDFLLSLGARGPLPRFS